MEHFVSNTTTLFEEPSSSFFEKLTPWSSDNDHDDDEEFFRARGDDKPYCIELLGKEKNPLKPFWDTLTSSIVQPGNFLTGLRMLRGGGGERDSLRFWWLNLRKVSRMKESRERFFNRRGRKTELGRKNRILLFRMVLWYLKAHCRVGLTLTVQGFFQTC